MDTVKNYLKCMVAFIVMCLLVTAVQAERRIGNNRADPLESSGSIAKSQPMQRPVLGFVYASGAGELRAIFGIPGSSVFSDPLALPFDKAGIHFAPGQECAIVEQANGAPIAAIDLTDQSRYLIIDIQGAVSTPDIVAFSPNGLWAAVYSSTEGLLQIIGGLPNDPHLTWEMMENYLPDDVRLLALADDGSTLLQGSIHDVVYLLANDGSASFLYQAKELAAMVFAPESQDVLIYDRVDQSASLLLHVAGEISHIPLLSGLTDVDGNVALWIDSKKAVIASTNPSEIWQVDRKSLEAINLQLSATPNMLQPLCMAGRLLLSYEPGRPAWILDVSGKTPSAYFVPAHPIADDESFRDRTPARQRGRARQPVRNLPARPQQY